MMDLPVMHLQRLEATNFRNLTGAIEFSPGLNLIYGANAQGKSSWLEGVYLLGSTKSFRTSHPKEVVAHGAGEALLRGTVARGGLTKDLQLLITESVKQTFVNGKREAVTRYLGNLNAIAFTADEMQVVRGGPEARRRFLDRGIFFTLPAYLGTLNEYGRVLKQKNALLRDASEAEDPLKFHDLIQPWNDQLVALGAEIHRARVNHVDQLRGRLNPELFQAEEITIRYKSSLEGRGDVGDYSNLLKERLNLRLKNEIAVGYSLVGPHRDDLEILCDGYEIARFGSSGQQRSALLILDIAQMNVYYQVFEEYPIFLIDDLDAELDRTRIEILLNHLDGRSQTIVSTSKRTIAERYNHRARTLLVQSGRVIEDPKG
ncbi:MAG TPA: DNA replication and repair protein RecF [Blastocatellia bacterium]|jgi:DNA replication and repair protein RecF|nr:DNA replication and repair protein RecF [Blastocatellia bacterium]